MLLRAPAGWPTIVVAAVAMLLLAGLDLAGSVIAKEAVARRSPLLGALGALIFLAVFWVFASSLQYGELAVLSFGWIVVLQVGLVLIDRFRYDVPMPPGKWIAVALLLLVQGYLMVGSPADDA